MEGIKDCNKINNISFNSDSSCFACATSDGFNVYTTHPLKEILKRDMYELGEIFKVEILEKTNILAFVGNANNQIFPKSKLIVWDDNLQKPVCDLQFPSDILGFHIYRDRLVVAIINRTYLYDLQNLQLLQTLDTAPNLQGICEINKRSGVMITMGRKQGSIRVSYPYRNLQQSREIQAHDGPIQITRLDISGRYLATASDKGTLIRIFDLSLLTQNNHNNYAPIRIFRRGADPATISSIQFDNSSKWVCVSSSTETIHIFAMDLPQSAIGWLGWAQQFYSNEIKSFISLKLPREIEGVKSQCCFHEGERAVFVVCGNGACYRFNLDLVGNVSVWDKPFDSFAPFRSEF